MERRISLKDWEDICHGCGACCELGGHGGTGIGCVLFDVKTCRCIDYENRQEKVATCARVRPANIHQLGLPDYCGYVRWIKGEDPGTAEKVKLIPFFLGNQKKVKPWLKRWNMSPVRSA